MSKDKNLFKKYEPIEDESIFYIGNSSTAQVKGKKYIYNLNSFLKRLLYVLEIRKKNIYANVLSNLRFKLIFEDKFTLSKGRILLEKNYIHEGMFKLNINKNKISHAHIVESSYL